MQVRAFQIRSAQIRALQLRAIHPRCSKIRAMQIGSSQIGSLPPVMPQTADLLIIQTQARKIALGKIQIIVGQFKFLFRRFVAHIEQLRQNHKSGFDIFAQKTYFQIFTQNLRQLHIYLHICDQCLDHLRRILRNIIVRQRLQSINAADARGDSGLAVLVLRKRFDTVRKLFANDSIVLILDLP